MRLAIPVDEKSMDTTVCPSFGRAPYYLFYDTKTQEKEFLDNDAASSQGGAGIKAAQFLVDHNTEVLLTPRCGQNAAEVLAKAKIQMYKTVSPSVKENLEAFTQEKLALLEDIHPGFHHGGRR
jgi:predicted Fe-Mo cluster-binding NifX family protein